MVLLTLAISTTALAVSTLYTDRSSWEAAVGSWATEDFNDAILNAEITVVSTVGYVDVNGYWWDRVDDGDYGGGGPVMDTTWTFATPIMAWGGTFDAAGPGGPGSSINVSMIDGSEVYVGTIPNTISGGFWGFVSTTPFTQVHIEDAALISGAQETYTMDDMVYLVNSPPDCSQAYADPGKLWPPNHKMKEIHILGVTDPDGDPVTITVTGVWQDEPTEGLGDGDVSPDATILGDHVEVRAERSGIEDGRVYHIYYRAEDDKIGICESVVTVEVPHDVKDTAVDGGPLYDSTLP